MGLLIGRRVVRGPGSLGLHRRGDSVDGQRRYLGTFDDACQACFHRVHRAIAVLRGDDRHARRGIVYVLLGMSAVRALLLASLRVVEMMRRRRERDRGWRDLSLVRSCFRCAFCGDLGAHGPFRSHLRTGESMVRRRRVVFAVANDVARWENERRLPRLRSGGERCCRRRSRRRGECRDLVDNTTLLRRRLLRLGKAPLSLRQQRRTAHAQGHRWVPLIGGRRIGRGHSRVIGQAVRLGCARLPWLGEGLAGLRALIHHISNWLRREFRL